MRTRKRSKIYTGAGHLVRLKQDASGDWIILHIYSKYTEGDCIPRERTRSNLAQKFVIIQTQSGSYRAVCCRGKQCTKIIMTLLVSFLDLHIQQCDSINPPAQSDVGSHGLVSNSRAHDSSLLQAITFGRRQRQHHRLAPCHNTCPDTRDIAAASEHRPEL